jgi:hypothetical protein
LFFSCGHDNIFFYVSPVRALTRSYIAFHNYSPILVKSARRHNIKNFKAAINKIDFSIPQTKIKNPPPISDAIHAPNAPYKKIFSLLSIKVNKFNINKAYANESILIPKNWNKNKKYNRQPNIAPVPIYRAKFLRELDFAFFDFISRIIERIKIPSKKFTRDNAANISRIVDFKEMSSPIGTCEKFLILRMNTKERDEKTINSDTFIKTNFFGFFENLTKEKT